MKRRKLLRLAAGIGAGLAVALACGWAAFERYDALHPPPMDRLARPSVEVVDREGALLRAFATDEGRWRMAADLDRIDPEFVDMLIAYEDKRFNTHFGIDPLALTRAALQLAANGRIISGGSTITMQLARLLAPPQKRSFGAKLRQALIALQLERRLSKRQILEAYLGLAPYGGNIEGVRAASLAWFGKEPLHLTPGEAALLVALPQSPEARRPDRFPAAAKAARQRVLDRMIGAGLVDAGEAKRIARVAVPRVKRPMPSLAPHLAREALDRDPLASVHRTTLVRRTQSILETVAREAAQRIGARISVAIVAAEIDSGRIVASVGSPGFTDTGRQGWIDMTRALRSPGSTLKPFIYGVAIENGLVLPETIISDRPADFAGYRPGNFDGEYRGDVAVREALQLSLNIPAVSLLDAIGPARLVARFRRAGVARSLSGRDYPGLAIGLGGTGFSLRELVQLYVNLASTAGGPIAIGDGVSAEPGALAGPRMVSRVAGWHVGDMLGAIAPPAGQRELHIAYKTGTSYGSRDAWSLGYDGRLVIGVWAGRPDNGAVPGITGIATAAPILFEAFSRIPEGIAPPPRAPAGAVRLAFGDLPPSLRRFNAAASGRYPQVRELAPRIVFPPAGAIVETRQLADGSPMPVIVKLQGGTPPFHLLSNGKPVEGIARRRQLQWIPDGPGQQHLTVLDSMGRASSLSLRVY